MFKISRLTDYGVVILRCLAQGDGEKRTMSASDLAKASGLPQPTVKKLLKIMAKHRFILAKRGAMGGYEMAQDPRDISLLKLFEAFEGPPAMTACMTNVAHACQIHADCPQKGAWHMVQQRIAKMLDGISLFELIGHGLTFKMKEAD